MKQIFPAIVWNSPSGDEFGSMPLGNGDVGANVWTDADGDILFYVSKADSWSDSDIPTLLKLARIRLSIRPRPHVPSAFEQRLDLATCSVQINERGGDGPHTVSLWVDANAPVIRCQIATRHSTVLTVTVENWRADDVVRAECDALLAHRTNIRSPVPASIHQQTGLDGGQFEDPIAGLSMGILVRGAGLTSSQSNQLISTAATEHDLSVHVLTTQGLSSKDWEAQIMISARQAEETTLSEAWLSHQAHWRAFHADSYLNMSDDSGAAREVADGYVVQRFMAACAGRGRHPIKFNGSLFTVSGTAREHYCLEGLVGTPDYRMWGGMYWWQNTRLSYAPMLASGDFAYMLPLFRMYREALPLCTAMTRFRFGHGGAQFPETMQFWGTWSQGEYEAQNPYIWTDFNLGLELTMLMLDYYEYTQDRHFVGETLMPIALGVVEFWEKHFRRGADGKLDLIGSQALETYWGVRNPACDVAGLLAVLPRLSRLTDEEGCDAGFRQRCLSLLAEVPALPQAAGLLLPAEPELPEPKNTENPELYAVYPFRLFGAGKPDLQLAQQSFKSRRFPGNIGWRQDALQAAYLGLPELAAAMVLERFRDKAKDQRFPGFYGPNFDWTPDQTHPSVAMAALQVMLLQTDLGLQLFEAWPRHWDVEFRLHAPGLTVVEGALKGGVLTRLSVEPSARLRDVRVAAHIEIGSDVRCLRT